MTRMNFVIAAALMSTASFTAPVAQAQFSEPAAYQAAHPDRDVLNGGQLTPAARAGLGQAQGPRDAYASQGVPAGAAPVVHSRRHRQRR
jgi:hypothetical protein